MAVIAIAKVVVKVVAAAATKKIASGALRGVPARKEPTEKPNTFFSKDKNQIEKFPLSDFFPDYNLL